MATIGDRIRGRRLELGLTQRALAGDDLSTAHISRLEANQRQPSMKVLRKLAPRLAVSVHWLETGAEDPAEQLARLVLEYERRPLPGSAAALAQAVLGQSR
ncbi:MAG: helix-turn-helix domain-containing protein [Gaiellaceae bacterium]